MFLCSQIQWRIFEQQIRQWYGTHLAWQCELCWLRDWYWQLFTSRLGNTQLWSPRGRVYKMYHSNTAMFNRRLGYCAIGVG